MTKWEMLEDYLTGVGTGQAFNSIALADDCGISRREASQLIRAYLDAQRRPNARTLHVLYRSGRSSASIWQVGERTNDIRRMSRQTIDDMKTRLTCALEPDLIRLGVINPRAGHMVDAMVQVFEANLALLASSV